MQCRELSNNSQFSPCAICHNIIEGELPITLVRQLNCLREKNHDQRILQRKTPRTANQQSGLHNLRFINGPDCSSHVDGGNGPLNQIPHLSSVASEHLISSPISHAVLPRASIRNGRNLPFSSRQRISSNRLLTGQTWFGSTRTTSPISGTFSQYETSTMPCSS